MKSKKRLTLIVLTIMAMIACLIGAVACGGGKDADVIDMYILPQNETLVDSDFSLPKTIGADGAVAVTWTSSNTNAIAIEDGGEEYTAKVTLQAEVTPVTLTIAAGKAKKDFTVRVDALNVFTFINHFTFAQEKTSVTKDFDLVTSTSFAGQSATIAWSVSDDASKSYIEVQNDNKVHIKPDYDLVDVKIDAKFSYKGDDVTQSYTFSVSPEFDPLQKVNRMYSQADYPLEISGYIVHAYEVSESYGNATMYIVSDDFTYGYYLYRAKFTGDASQYVKGAHVTYSGGTAKNYNGLWENNSNGTVSADGKPAGDIDGNVYAMDTDFLANVPSLLWRESTLVSLSGWKVTKGEKPTGADADLFTLEKNSKKITVRISKYVNRTNDELTALCNVYDSLKDGDFVDVKGILGCYKNNFQIQPILASDIKKVDAAVENKDGDKLAAAVKAVNDAVKANIGSLVAADKNFTMPTDKDGVTISYKLTPSSLPASTFTVSINGGDFSVKPTTSEKNYDIQVTYTLGGKNYYSFFKLRNWKLTAQQIVDTVESYAKKERIANITASGDVTLPDIDALGATLTWSVKGEMPTWLKISGNKATVSQLPEFESELVFVVTISLDGAQSKSYEYKAVKVSARPNVTFTAIDEAKAGDYVFSLYQAKVGKQLYATGAVNSSNFGVTTDDHTKAATFTLASTDGGWTIKVKSGSNEGKYLSLNDKHQMQYVDEATAWTWDAELKVFTLTINEDGEDKIYYLGTYNTFETMSASETWRISGDKAADVGVSQFPAHFGEVKKGADKTDQDKVNAAVADVNDKYTVEVAGDWLLPTCKVNGVTFSWAIKGTSTYRLTTEKTKLIVNELPASDATVTLTVTATLDGKDTVTASKDVTVTITKPAQYTGSGTLNDPYTVADAIALAGTIGSNGYLGGSDAPVELYVKGYVIKVDGWSDTNNNWTKVYIGGTKDADSSDKTQSVQLYRLALDDTFLKVKADLVVGAEITVFGCLQYYNGQAEVSHNPKTNVNCKAVAYTAPTGGGTGGDQPSTGDKGTVSNPYTVAEVIALGAKLGDNEYYKVDGVEKEIYIKGYVTNVGTIYQTYGLSSVEIADTKGGTTILLLYTVNWGDAMAKPESIPSASPLQVGDYIVIHGFLKNFYNSKTNEHKLEIDKNTAKTTYPTLTTWQRNGQDVEQGTTPGGSTGGEGGGTNPQPGETEEGLIYTLTTTTKGSSGNLGAYDESNPCTVNGVTWDVMGNTQIGDASPNVPQWRFGGKKTTCANADRKITGRGVITGTVKRVVIAFGTNSNNITVNSIKLNVYSTDPGVEGATLVVSKDVTYEKDGTVTITADGDGWTNCYFELVMNLNVTETSNKWISINSIKFYSTTASAAAAAATAMLPGKQTNA